MLRLLAGGHVLDGLINRGAVLLDEGALRHGFVADDVARAIGDWVLTTLPPVVEPLVVVDPLLAFGVVHYWSGLDT